VDEKRHIITRNEQGEVSPPHRARLAGGVRFDGVERVTTERAGKRAATKTDHRSMNIPKQFHKAARSRKPMKLNVYD